MENKLLVAKYMWTNFENKYGNLNGSSTSGD